jgi:hypothetical protein
MIHLSPTFKSRGFHIGVHGWQIGTTRLHPSQNHAHVSCPSGEQANMNRAFVMSIETFLHVANLPLILS